MDSVLAQQVAMNGGGPAEMSPTPDTYGGGEYKSQVPQVVGAMVLGSALTLVALRVLGIRFSFGAQIGGGA